MARHVDEGVIERQATHLHIGHFLIKTCLYLSALQNATRLGTAVGLEYQSPPPLYWRTAS